MKLFYIMCLYFLVLNTGCVKKGAPAEPGQIAYDFRDLIAYEDKARGVVCYRIQGRDGMSCIKLENK